MKFEGTLAAWNADRGHGLIAPLQGGQELFVHVSAFPADGPPPALGEALSFEIVTDGDGRKLAARVQRGQRKTLSVEQRLAVPLPKRPWRELRRQRRRRIGYAVAALLLLAAVLGWLELNSPNGRLLAQRSASVGSPR